MKYPLYSNASKKKSIITGCNSWMIFYDLCKIWLFSESIQKNFCVSRFQQFSPCKIEVRLVEIFFDVSVHPISMFANSPFKKNTLIVCVTLFSWYKSKIGFQFLISCHNSFHLLPKCLLYKNLSLSSVYKVFQASSQWYSFNRLLIQNI